MRALPQGGPLAWLEIALLLGLALQLARLFWVVATPVGPLGEWRPPQPAAMAPAARDALLARFDPFYRTGGGDAAGPAVVTSLALKLFGIRLNEASGQGSAIIATPDGVQSSVAVGGEIVAGVKLKSVTLDHVVIDRNGTEETLYLDQSTPAEVVQPGVTPVPPVGAPPAQFNAPPPAAPAPAGSASEAIRTQIGFSPRVSDGRVNGLSVSPRGDGAVFRNTGFRDGDVIVRVDGRPVSSVGDLQALEARLRPGVQVAMSVERGAQTIPLAIVLPSR
ncbi:MAG: type II secretion system protein N [Pseudomonadota bacterium]